MRSRFDSLPGVAQAIAQVGDDAKQLLTDAVHRDFEGFPLEGQINIDTVGELRRDDDGMFFLVRFSTMPLDNTSQFATRVRAGLPKWRLKRAEFYIETHLEEQITTAALAEAAGLSPTYFAGQFKASTGLCPHDYVTRKRIEAAQGLLLDRNMKIIEIAIGVGFQTQAHFTTSFKKIVGITPWKWRQNNYSEL
jgi:AraC-like DNA-binding protein